MSNKCPSCQKYIIGEYCFFCKANIHDVKVSDKYEVPDFIKEMMKGEWEES